MPMERTSMAAKLPAIPEYANPTCRCSPNRIMKVASIFTHLAYNSLSHHIHPKAYIIKHHISINKHNLQIPIDYASKCIYFHIQKYTNHQHNRSPSGFCRRHARHPTPQTPQTQQPPHQRRRETARIRSTTWVYYIYILFTHQSIHILYKTIYGLRIRKFANHKSIVITSTIGKEQRKRFFLNYYVSTGSYLFIIYIPYTIYHTHRRQFPLSI